jgi:hypothetical protein
MSTRRPVLLAVARAAVILSCSARAQAPDDRGVDPTGVWYGERGPLALVRAGDTLSFSYSAVFGATVLLRDGLGVAGFVGDGTWEYVDEQGTVSFTTKAGTVTMGAGRGSPPSVGRSGLATPSGRKAGSRRSAARSSRQRRAFSSSARSRRSRGRGTS